MAILHGLAYCCCTSPKQTVCIGSSAVGIDHEIHGHALSIVLPPLCLPGVLTSRPTSRDIKIDSFSMSMAGTELIKDCSIELTIGRRYGLLGQNGCGKTNFLQCIANREASCVDARSVCR
jgi:hypothetical protein